MRVFRFGPEAAPAKGLDAIAIRPDWSLEELELALHLAKRAFDKKTSIGRSLSYEFLLWLAGKTDIRSAMEATAPEQGRDFILVVFSGDVPLPNKLPLGLKKEAEPLALERISLSRVKN